MANKNILYLVHDLTDPAVYKRVRMLKDGGARVTVAGFRRQQAPVHDLAGCHTINFGQTYNGGFFHRIGAVLLEIAMLGSYREAFENADIILARNLEMLAIGVRGKSMQPKATLVYESLDIHRLLVKPGMIGKSLRKLEGWLSRRASALLTSSPAFIREYFEPVSEVKLPTRLVENKIYSPEIRSYKIPARPLQTPWRIGWFGAIRCKKSLRLLSDLVKNSNGQVEVIIRGRPALDQFDDFHQIISETPGLVFQGSYRSDELPTLYQGVHFTWAIDMFEEGLNSAWLLPNRLYEGGVHHSVPIATSGTETSQFLNSLGIGVTLDEPKDSSLDGFFKSLKPETYQQLQDTTRAIPHSTWVFTKQDCKELVKYLGSF